MANTAPNRWAVREAAEATFYNLDTGAPVVTLNTLKMTEVSTTGETVYAQGGRGNAKLVGFSGDREATVALQDAIFDNEALAMLTGNKIGTEAKTLEFFEDIRVKTPGEVELKREPEADTISAGRMDNGKFIPTGDESFTAAEKTVPIADAVVGERIRVYYKATVANAKTITVTASDFGGTFRLVVDVLVRDEDTGKVFYAQFIAPKAKIEDEFTFSFSPDGDPSVLDIPLQILKDTDSENMWELVIFDDEE